MDADPNFDQIRLALMKTTNGRSYDDLLNLRQFIFQLTWVTNFFAGTDRLDVINEFCRNLGIEQYDEEEIIFNQGDNFSSDKLYFMISGECELRQKHLVDLAHGMFEERERIESKVTTSMAFGEEVIESDDPRPSTAKCTTKCTVITISKSNIKMIRVDMANDVKHSNEFRQGAKGLVMRVLSKRREHRTKQDIEAVATFLKTRIAFFGKFSTDQQNELCRITESVSFWERQVLFKQGQVGQAFYIVLTGTVEVYVARANDDAPAPPNGGGTASVEQEMYGNLVASIGVGGTFGERALESDASLRGGTVLTYDGKTELLVIYKEDYYNLVSVMTQTDLMEKISLLRKTDIFKDADVSHLKVLAKKMEPRVYKLDEIVFTEGSKATEMLIISKGECRVQVQIEAVRAECNPDGSPVILTASESMATQSCLGKHKISVGRLGPASVLGAYVLLCENSLEDVFHVETVISSSLTQVFVLWKNDFLMTIPEAPRSALRGLVHSHERKLIPLLWDNEPHVIDEYKWKSMHAWKSFGHDLSRKNFHSDVVKKLHLISAVKLTPESGNPTDRLKPVHSSSTNTIQDSSRPRTQSDDKAGGSLLTRDRKHELKGHIDGVEVIRQQIDAATYRLSVLQDSPVVLKALDRLHYRQELKQNLSKTDLGFTQKKTDIRRTPKLLRQFDSTKGTPFEMDGGDELAKPDMTDHSHSPELDTPFIATVVQNPFFLLQYHREAIPPSKGTMASRRPVECFIRFCGGTKTFSEAKNFAFLQMKQAYHNLLKSDVFKRSEVHLDWSVFTAFENIPLNQSDFFIVYCRNTPLEFAYLNPSANLLHFEYPAEAKILSQRFACVKTLKMNAQSDDSVSHPLLLRELHTVDEVLAATFTLKESLKFALTATDFGSQLLSRKMSVEKLLKSRPSTRSVGVGSRTVMSTASHEFSAVGDFAEKTLCVVPLYEWLPMGDGSFAQLQVDQLIYNSKDAQGPQALPVATTSSSSSSSTLQANTNTSSTTEGGDIEELLDPALLADLERRMQISLRETGLLKTSESEDHGKLSTAAQNSPKKAANIMTSSHTTLPIIKILEDEITKKDLGVGLARRIEDAQEQGLQSRPRSGHILGKAFDNHLIDSTAFGGDDHHTKTMNATTALALFQERESLKERDGVGAVIAHARRKIIKMNDALCQNAPTAHALKKAVSGKRATTASKYTRRSESDSDDESEMSRSIRRTARREVLQGDGDIDHRDTLTASRQYAKVASDLAIKQIGDHLQILKAMESLPVKSQVMELRARHHSRSRMRELLSMTSASGNEDDISVGSSSTNRSLSNGSGMQAATVKSTSRPMSVKTFPKPKITVVVNRDKLLAAKLESLGREFDKSHGLPTFYHHIS